MRAAGCWLLAAGYWLRAVGVSSLAYRVEGIVENGFRFSGWRL